MKKPQKNHNAYIQGLKNIAKSSFEDDEELLMIWWSNKYKLPRNHPLLLQMHLEELFVEYYQDQHKNKNADSELTQEMIEEDEKWEGETSQEHEHKIKKKLSKLPQVDLSKYQEDEPFEEINDTF